MRAFLEKKGGGEESVENAITSPPHPTPPVDGHRIVSALASNREAKDLTFSHLSRQVCYLGSSKRAATHIHTLRLAPGVSNALPRIDIQTGDGES